MSLSPYAESRTLDFNLGAAPAAGTGVSYISLHTGSPPTPANEVSGGAYARQQFVYTKSGSTPTVAANTNTTSFPQATASWGTVTTFGIYDASTGGNLITSGALSQSQAIASGNQAQFAAGALTVSVN